MCRVSRVAFANEIFDIQSDFLGGFNLPLINQSINLLLNQWGDIFYLFHSLMCRQLLHPMATWLDDIFFMQINAISDGEILTMKQSFRHLGFQLCFNCLKCDSIRTHCSGIEWFLQATELLGGYSFISLDWWMRMNIFALFFNPQMGAEEISTSSFSYLHCHCSRCDGYLCQESFSFFNHFSTSETIHFEEHNIFTCSINRVNDITRIFTLHDNYINLPKKPNDRDMAERL